MNDNVKMNETVKLTTLIIQGWYRSTCSIHRDKFLQAKSLNAHPGQSATSLNRV